MTMEAASPAEDDDGLTFESLGLRPEVMRAIKEVGYETPTPVQHATYPHAIERRDIIVQARTGTGKTAAFAIPLVDRIVTEEPGVQALVLAPTRELALQSAREIARLGQHRDIGTVAVYGGAPMGAQVKELADGAQIVSGTPGRVLDHLKRGTLDASGLKALVLDEMDEMLSMGFAKELNAILEIIPGADARQTMCFSATVDGSVRRHAENHMNDPLVVSLSSDAVGASEITHFMYMVSGTNRAGDLIEVLNSEDPESAIIFCNMRSETERVATQLQGAGFNADWLNGDLPQRDRERIMSSTREGRLRYLVATDVAARGIDISHLTHVINYSFPESAATYVHRTGRTGRAGRTGCAISLVAPHELGRLYYLRLEYGISPVERSLPNAGENKARQELDRIKLIEAMASGAPSTADIDLARRLLTHPEVERILGGLLRGVFGDREGVDEDASQARRDRNPPAVPGARRTSRSRRSRDDEDDSSRASRPRGERRSPRSDRSDRAVTREADERPSEPRRAATTEAPATTEAEATAPATDEEGAPKRRRRRRSRKRSDDETREGSGDASEAAERTQETQGTADEGLTPTQDRAPQQEGSGRGDRSEATPRDGNAGDGDSAQASDTTQDATIFLNVGRRDGVRPGEVAKLVSEAGGLARGDVGRIRIRDRYTFVEVPAVDADSIIEQLQGAELNDRPLEPERAKVSRS